MEAKNAAGSKGQVCRKYEGTHTKQIAVPINVELSVACGLLIRAENDSLRQDGLLITLF